MENKFIVSSSPHFQGKTTTRRIMLDVIIALVPSMIMSVVYFGTQALMLIGVCVASCVLCEYVSRKVMKRDTTIGDLSAVVTGVLLALNLPATINPLIAMFGSIVAIVVVKQMFGGIGMNFANPAIAARIVLLVSFPSAMMTWVKPFYYTADVDTMTSATPLAAGEGAFSYLDLLIGNHGGCIGETCAIALLIGGIYLIARRVIFPPIPLVYIGVVALLSFAIGLDPLYQVLSGGLLLGAFFMATDYTTTPSSPVGKIIFAAGCGIITVLLRAYSNLPEGVSFSILLMNILSPLIDNITIRKPYGFVKKKKNGGK